MQGGWRFITRSATGGGPKSSTLAKAWYRLLVVLAGLRLPPFVNRIDEINLFVGWADRFKVLAYRFAVP